MALMRGNHSKFLFYLNKHLIQFKIDSFQFKCYSNLPVYSGKQSFQVL